MNAIAILILIVILLFICVYFLVFTGENFGVMNPQNGSLISIGFSFFVVIIASLNLVLDFDF